MAKQVHVVYNGDIDKFQIKQDGAKRSSGNFDTQYQAIERAKEIAINQREELTIHNMRGEVRQKNSYGNDPYPPKG